VDGFDGKSIQQMGLVISAMYAYYVAMKRVSLFFSEPMLKWLTDDAKKRDLSFSEVVRDMLRRQIELEKKKAKE
jgi:hypothetical protein